ncbi:MAG: leucine-rich repeat domain-containing protein [Prevotella sp.]|nr:leucine-rich repeat domain-containing protein [Prevotella sp.]
MKKQILLIVLLFLPMMSSAYTGVAVVDDIKYYINTDDQTAEVRANYSNSINTYTGDIVIPKTIEYEGETCNVTSIGYEAFDGCSGLTSITIPSSVTSIGYGAFLGCKGLTNVTIPSSVTSIGDWSFNDCSSLISISIPSSVSRIGSYVFFGCSSLTSISIPNSVTSIGEDAFYGCSALTSIDIPTSVTSIGNYAFSNCSGLTSVTIPNSVTIIGKGVFVACNGLISISVESGNTKYDSRDNCNGIIETETNTLITGCQNTTIPNSVTSIEESAFSGCSSLTFIDIPTSVISIGNYAFYGCSALTSIDIPTSVTSIGKQAFYGCSSLTSVTIPEYVTSIGLATFAECTSMTEITIPSSVTSIGDWAFYHCASLTSFIIPSNITSIGSDAFQDCSNLTSVTIPSSVTSIGGYAFYGCSNLTSVKVDIETPLSIDYSETFSNRANATLYVPAGSKTLYEAADYWKEFKEIIEFANKCATPTITYANGKVRCTCETEGVTYVYTITPAGSTGESTDGVISLGTSFTVSVKATRDGYTDSDIATTTINLSQVGDMDGDGQVNINDVTTLVNIILGR